MMKRNTTKLSKALKQDEEHVQKASVNFDKVRQSELTPKPSGKQFYDLLTKSTNKSITNFIPVSPISLNYDQNVYQAVNIVVGMVIGKLTAQHKKVPAKIMSFLAGDAMVSLKDNQFHREYENPSRRIAYDFIKSLQK